MEDELLELMNQSAGPGYSRPGMTRIAYGGRTRPIHPDEFQSLIELAGMKSPQEIYAPQEEAAARYEQMLPTLKAALKPQLDLSPLMALAEAESGHKVAYNRPQDLQGTMESVMAMDNRLDTLKTATSKSKADLLAKLLTAQIHEPSFTSAKTLPQPKDPRSHTAGQSLEYRKARDIQMDVDRFTGEMTKERLTNLYENLVEAKKVLGDFDPDNKTPVTGVGGYGKGWFERTAPEIINAKKAEAQKNFAALAKPVYDFRHKLSGAAFSVKEAKSYEEVAGLLAKMDPSVIRSFMQELAEGGYATLNTLREGVPAPSRPELDRRKLLTPEKFKEFVAPVKKQKKASDMLTPQAPAKTTKPALKASDLFRKGRMQ